MVGVALHPVEDRVRPGVGAGGDVRAPLVLLRGRGLAEEVLQRTAHGGPGHHQLLGLAVVHQGIRFHRAGLGRVDGHVQRHGLGVVVIGIAEHLVPDDIVAGLGAGGNGLAPFRLILGRGLAQGVHHRAVRGAAGPHQLLGLAAVDQRTDGRGRGHGRIGGDDHNRHGGRSGIVVLVIRDEGHVVLGFIAVGHGGHGGAHDPLKVSRHIGIDLGSHRAAGQLAVRQRLAVGDGVRHRRLDDHQRSLRNGRLDGGGSAILVVPVALHPVPDGIGVGVGLLGDRVLPIGLIRRRGIADEVLQLAAFFLDGRHQRLGFFVVGQRVRGHLAGGHRLFDGHFKGAARYGIIVVRVAKHLVPDLVGSGILAGGHIEAPASGILRDHIAAQGIHHGAVHCAAGINQRLVLTGVGRAQLRRLIHFRGCLVHIHRHLAGSGLVIVRIFRSEDHGVLLIPADSRGNGVGGLPGKAARNFVDDFNDASDIFRFVLAQGFAICEIGSECIYEFDRSLVDGVVHRRLHRSGDILRSAAFLFDFGRHARQRHLGNVLPGICGGPGQDTGDAILQRVVLDGIVGDALVRGASEIYPVFVE